MPDYDLTVIGSGPGRYVAAIHAARLGARVAILEQKDTEWGGTCLNWSCIPTKALIHGAEVFQTVRRVPEFGVRVPEPEIDWPAMQGRKDRVVEAMRKGVQSLLKANGVEMITARGRLAGGTRVSADGRELSSGSVLLAPGSIVALPPVPGVELVLTSNTILGLDHVPESMVVIGGGVRTTPPSRRASTPTPRSPTWGCPRLTPGPKVRMWKSASSRSRPSVERRSSATPVVW